MDSKSKVRVNPIKIIQSYMCILLDTYNFAIRLFYYSHLILLEPNPLFM